MADPIIRLKPRKERPVLLGHPWIFSGAVANLDPTMEPGTIVTVQSASGEVLGRAYVNPRCAIAVRMLTRADEPIDAEWLQRRVAAARELRRAVLPPGTDAYRLINGEGDFLPGFIADVYAATVVIQCLTAGAARLKRLLVQALQAIVPGAGLYERSVGNVRREEGLGAEEGILAGDVSNEPVQVAECGLRFLVDVRAGQKTGFFLDQRDNRQLVRSLAGGRSVLNAFGYTGAFAVYAAAGGARQVTSVDSSARALELARRNWACNALPAAAGEFVEADVFRYLRECERAADLLVLDPPALVKRRAELARGARAYKDLHLWAFRRAMPGAYVATFSCSQHVSPEVFWGIVHAAARDAGRSVQVLRQLGAGADHPVSVAHPEGLYLKGLLLRVGGGHSRQPAVTT